VCCLDAWQCLCKCLAYLPRTQHFRRKPALSALRVCVVLAGLNGSVASILFACELAVISLPGAPVRGRAMTSSEWTFDPQTLAMLKAVFEEACDVLPPHQRTQEMRSNLASRILKRAAQGGLSPAQLRTYALTEAVSPVVRTR